MRQLSELREMPYRDRLKHITTNQAEAHPDLMKPPKIYIASKSRHRPRWRGLRDTGGYNIISKWIDVDDSLIGDPDRTIKFNFNYPKLWADCVTDVKNCDVLVLYAEAGEHLKGALVEVGIAIALGKEIMVTGVLEDNGTWFHYGKVELWDDTIEQLLEFLYGQEV